MVFCFFFSEKNLSKKKTQKKIFFKKTICRISPVIPWNVLNYALALTSIGWRAYFLASAAAVAPWAALFAQLGSLAASLADLFEASEGKGGSGSGGSGGSGSSGSGKMNEGPFGEHTLLVTAAGAALAVVAASYIVFLVRRELRTALRAEGGAVGAAALDELTPLEAGVEDDDDGEDDDEKSDLEGGDSGDEGGDNASDKTKDVEKGQP